jgi:Asp-tRNA(Asn)/Glu-tRNA(Gln) amidotransferase A subunit family amidase
VYRAIGLYLEVKEKQNSHQPQIHADDRKSINSDKKTHAALFLLILICVTLRVSAANCMTELIQNNLTDLAKMIRAREVSPVEVVEAHLQQIENLNPRLNAIVTIAPDLLDRARAAEKLHNANETIGPLHGLPLTVKDTIETAGLRSTSGSPTRANYVPTRDAPAVARLKQAGAIVIGKTNAAEMAMDYTADNPVFGRTNNPHDLSKTPGGSSGGEAAAIASCMSPGGIGSDLAGSIRIPAHFCGITGLKPSTGRVPGEGQFPPSTGPYSLGAAIGPMARSVGDLRLLFEVLTDARSGVATSVADLKGCGGAWYTDDGVTPVTEETKQAVRAAAQALRDAGVRVEEQRPPYVDRGYDLWLKLFSRASVVQLRAAYEGYEAEAGSFVSWRLRTADETPPPTLDQYIASWMERDRLRSELLDWLDTTPLIIAPVGATPAYDHDTLKVTVGELTISNFKAFSYAQTFNVFDLPVVTVPVGCSASGLPIGVQVVGRPYEEELVMAAATVVEQAALPRQRPEN